MACGDAVGTTVEFKLRGTFPLVTDMVGGGPFNEWTTPLPTGFEHRRTGNAPTS